jgi:hypothetical protein
MCKFRQGNFQKIQCFLRNEFLSPEKLNSKSSSKPKTNAANPAPMEDAAHRGFGLSCIIKSRSHWEEETKKKISSTFVVLTTEICTWTTLTGNSFLGRVREGL